jgi:carboxylesterase type B
LPLTGQNLGFLDQRFALQWVQYNIRSFGGNPQKVTIFGESAGALSVDALVTSYLHNPPFRAAIEQSGEVFLGGFLDAGLNSTKSWLTLAASLNCSQSTSNLACIRAANATAIKSIIEHAALGFQPVVDNVTLIGNPTAARAAHNVAPVPVLMGTNGQEGRVLVVGQNNLSAYINGTFGALPAVASQVAQAFTVGVGGTQTDYEAISQIYTELVFQCPQAITANESAAAGYPTWRYLFNASFPNTQAIPNLAAYHSSEIPIVFGTYPQTDVTAQESALSQYMRGAWARFAKNPVAGPGWNAIGTFAGTDLGVLGTNGTSGVTVIKESDVDGRCEIFTPLYNLLGA